MNSRQSAMAWSAWKEAELSLCCAAVTPAGCLLRLDFCADLAVGRLLGQQLSPSRHRTTRPARRNSRMRSRSSEPSRKCRTRRRPRRACLQLLAWCIIIVAAERPMRQRLLVWSMVSTGLNTWMECVQSPPCMASYIGAWHYCTSTECLPVAFGWTCR
jgi:hypothetical protein